LAEFCQISRKFNSDETGKYKSWGILPKFHRIVAPSILSSNTHRVSSWPACQFSVLYS